MRKRGLQNPPPPVSPPEYGYMPEAPRRRKKSSGCAWFLIGFFFGILGLLIAAVTDEGDGRTKAALGGCLIESALIGFALLAIFGIGGASILMDSVFDGIHESLNPTATVTPVF